VLLAFGRGKMMTKRFLAACARWPAFGREKKKSRRALAGRLEVHTRGNGCVRRMIRSNSDVSPAYGKIFPEGISARRGPSGWC